MTLMRPATLPDVASLREAIEHLFDDSVVFPREWRLSERFERPAIDAYTTAEAFVVKIAVPGLKADDVQTTITGDVLTVEGKFREETKREEQGYIYRELSRGDLRRSIRLPAGLDTEAAEGAYGDGILTVTIPKVEEAKPREIKVKAA